MTETAPGRAKDTQEDESEVVGADWTNSESNIVFQGRRVPRNKDEIENPALIEERIAAEDFTNTTAALDVEAGQDAIPEVDEALREALGIAALPDDIVEMLDKSKRR